MSAATPRPRGARRSPPHKAFAAMPHRARATPSSFVVVPSQLNMWGNDTYGDCVTAEEAFAKAAYPLQCGLPETFLPSQDVINWAQQNGFLNGADLTSVMDAMISSGLTSGGVNYKDGPYQSVDWTNDAVLSSAIFTGPVKIGVAANQLESAVGNTNGWFATGFTSDTNEDHCVALCGFGTAQELATALSVTVPAGMDPTSRCYLLYTWSTIGIIDRQSMLNITGEAWVRTPTTVGVGPVPAPVPTPTPGPGPSPSPTPTPSPVPSTFAVTGTITSGWLLRGATFTGTAVQSSSGLRLVGAVNWLALIGDVMALVAAINAKNVLTILTSLEKLIQDLGVTVPAALTGLLADAEQLIADIQAGNLTAVEVDAQKILTDIVGLV